MLGQAALVLVAAGLLSVTPVADDGLSCGVTRTPSVANLHNDLDYQVELHLCESDDCARLEDGSAGLTLAPGDSNSVSVSSVGVPNVYLVRTSTGRRLGCLPLVSPHLRHTEIEVQVSEAVPCRDDVDEDAFWPARWARME